MVAIKVMAINKSFGLKKWVLLTQLKGLKWDQRKDYMQNLIIERWKDIKNCKQLFF